MLTHEAILLLVHSSRRGGVATRKPRILLADDDLVWRQEIQGMLDSEFEIVGSVGDGRDLIESARRLTPDVVIADISMPNLNGLRAARLLREEMPHVRIVFLTVHEAPAYIAEARKVGASGYVVKRLAGLDLLSTIHAVLGTLLFTFC